MAFAPPEKQGTSACYESDAKPRSKDAQAPIVNIAVLPAISSDGLGWDAESAQEHFTHVAPIPKPGFPRNYFKWMAALFNHHPGCFQAQTFDSFGGRLPSLRRKHAAELART
jgi:hypothetical protein